MKPNYPLPEYKQPSLRHVRLPVESNSLDSSLYRTSISHQNMHPKLNIESTNSQNYFLSSPSTSHSNDSNRSAESQYGGSGSGRQVLSLANQIAEYLRGNYTHTPETHKSHVAKYQAVESSLSRSGFMGLRDESLKPFFEENDIFYDFQHATDGLRGFTSGFVGGIVDRHPTQGIYVCELETSDLHGVDFYRSVIGKAPTLAQKRGKRLLLNQSGVRDAFKLAILEIDTILLFSKTYDESPYDFPSKRKHSELFRFMDGCTDPDVLTKQYVSMFMNKHTEVLSLTNSLYSYVKEV